MQNKYLELTHIQKLPLEDPSLNLHIPRPSMLFHACEILPTIVSKVIFARVDSWTPEALSVGLNGLLSPCAVALPTGLHGGRANPSAPHSCTRWKKPIKQIVLGLLLYTPRKSLRLPCITKKAGGSSVHQSPHKSTCLLKKPPLISLPATD